MAIDKNAVIKEAQKFAAKGQFDKAIVEWKKIARESPNDANVFNTIGDLCLKKNAKPEAVEAYKKAADILAKDGFTSKAIALYKKVLNIDPRKIEAHLALADLNAEKGLTGNALESYKLVADYFTRSKETVKALGIYQKMADLNASNVAFRLKLADMYAKEGMKKEAIRAYLQAADVHVSKEAFNEARQLFEKALALDPDSKDVYHKAGLVYFKEGKFVEACKALKPAFESDPSNTELSGLYLDALAGAGRGAEAEEVYQKLLSQQPERADLREKLYRFYLSEKEYDKAFAEVSTLANEKIENKDFDGAEEVLKGFIAEAPGTVDGRRALGALYKTVGKGNEAAAVLVQAAEILIENGDMGGAKDVLARAIEVVPDHAEARMLLERLERTTALSGPEHAAPQAASSQWAASMIREASPPSIIEDPAIAEAFTEVDVLVKYGLATKALEQLESLAQKFPDSIQIRTKLRDLYGDLGNMGKAAAHMLVLADLYAAQGMQDQAGKVLQAALQMDPDNPQIKARLTAAGPAAAQPQEFLFGEPEGTVPGLEGSMPSLDHSFDTAGLDMTPAGPGEDLSFPGTSINPEFAFDGQPAAGPISEEISFDQPFAPSDIPVQEEYAGPERELQGNAFPDRIDIGEIWAEAEFYYQQGLFDEARKHYEKIIEFAPDNALARERIAELLREQENTREFSKLVDNLDGLEGYVEGAAAAEMPPSASDEEAVRLLMHEIAQLKQKSAPVKDKLPTAKPEAPAAPRDKKETGRSSAARVPRQPGESFFDLSAELNDLGNVSADRTRQSRADSEDFFDLASELRDELSSISIPPPSSESGEDQSLDDIFEEFKKGVEQQAIREDADTHYNLGVAYKEMGLLDDAIGEFILTPEDESKFVQSRHMLGLCYIEKGDYQNAIAEIQIAIMSSQSAGAGAGELIGMRYDLALAYQCAGNIDGALKEFQQVCAVDRKYRDAADKIKDLQRGGAISLERLKNDIEKEISSKFLEEGERIQREEKTRKNEKVRS